VPVSLSDAIKSGNLDAFIVQEHSRGIGPIDRAEFDGAVAKVIKEPRLADQTSHSASGGNSSGKRTRRGTDQDASN
jgi:hypothetical protein